MKTYVDYSLFTQEFNVAATLTMEGDGRFSYYESWSSYGGGTGGSVDGIWWRAADSLFFRCERQDGVLLLRWNEGQAREAVEQNDSIDLGDGFTLSLQKG